MKLQIPPLPFICVVNLWLANLFAAFPPFEGVFHPIDPTRVEHQADQDLFKALDSPSNKPPARQKVIEVVDRLERTLPNPTLRTVTSPGRMAIPDLLAHRYAWKEDVLIVGLLTDDPRLQSAYEQYRLAWKMLRYVAPDVAFSNLSKSSDQAQSNVLDVLRLNEALGIWPGNRIKPTFSKDQWNQLHGARNPCVRLIALEWFDSFEQSPESMLALYRECLFGACSYMEARALEALAAHPDYRTAVVSLLDEYIKSNPEGNDGTLHPSRTNFRDLSSGAQKVRDAHEAYIAKNGEQTVDRRLRQSASSTSVQRLAPMASAVPSSESTSKQSDSTPWMLWAVMITAAAGLLWLVLKRRAK